MKAILCIGDVNLDFVSRISAYPVEGSETLVNSHELRLGGSACNVAIALRLLGYKSELLARIGVDENGKLVSKRLRESKLFPSRVIISRKGETGLSIVFIGDNGLRTMFTFRGVNIDAWDDSTKDLDIDEFIGLFVSSYIFAKGLMGESKVSKFLHRAKGKTVFFDIRETPVKASAHEIARILDATNFLFISEDAYQSVKDLGIPKSSVVVRYGTGNSGCTIVTSNEEFSYPPKQTVVRSLLAANDSFIAAFIASHLRGSKLEDSAQFANYVKAKVVSDRYWESKAISKVHISSPL